MMDNPKKNLVMFRKDHYFGLFFFSHTSNNCGLRDWGKSPESPVFDPSTLTSSLHVHCCSLYYIWYCTFTNVYTFHPKVRQADAVSSSGLGDPHSSCVRLESFNLIKKKKKFSIQYYSALLYKQCPLKAHVNTDIPYLFYCMLLLAVRDTWSKACWVGIFQHVTILRIISGRQPHAAFVARQAHCQHLDAPHTDCGDCGTVSRLMGRPTAPCASKLFSKVSQGGGVQQGVWAVIHSQKKSIIQAPLWQISGG